MECAAVLDARLWKEPFAAEEAHCDSALVDCLAVRLADDYLSRDVVVGILPFVGRGPDALPRNPRTQPLLSDPAVQRRLRATGLRPSYSDRNNRFAGDGAERSPHPRSWHESSAHNDGSAVRSWGSRELLLGRHRGAHSFRQHPYIQYGRWISAAQPKNLTHVGPIVARDPSMLRSRREARDTSDVPGDGWNLSSPAGTR
jgi:hypothetical protein